MVKLWGESVKSRPAHPIDKEGPITEPSPRYSRTLDQTTLDLTKAIIKRRGSFLGACRDRRTTADPKFPSVQPNQINALEDGVRSAGPSARGTRTSFVKRNFYVREMNPRALRVGKAC